MEKQWRFSKNKAYFGTEGIPEDIEDYETTDIYEGAYLLTKDFKLKKIKTNERGRRAFTFVGENIKEEALGFLNNDLISVRNYAENVVRMKEKAKK